MLEIINDSLYTLQHSLEFLFAGEVLFFNYLVSELEDERNNFQILKNFLEQQIYKNIDNDKFIFDFLKVVNAISKLVPLNEVMFSHLFNVIDVITLNDFLIDKFTNKNIFKLFNDNKVIILHFISRPVHQIQIDGLVAHLFRLDPKMPQSHDQAEFFLPEVFTYDKKIALALTEKYAIDDLYQEFENNPSYIQQFIQERREFHSENSLLTVIRNDDLQTFFQILILRPNILKCTIDESVYEINIFVNENPDMIIIEYAMLFGAEKIFKLLIEIQEAVSLITPESIKYAIIGGNEEIIKTMIEYYNQSLNVELMIKTAIMSHRFNMLNFIINHGAMKIDKHLFFLESLNAYNMISISIFFNENIDFLYSILENGEIGKYADFIQLSFFKKFVVNVLGSNVNIKDENGILFHILMKLYFIGQQGIMTMSLLNFF